MRATGQAGDVPTARDAQRPGARRDPAPGLRGAWPCPHLHFGIPASRL